MGQLVTQTSSAASLAGRAVAQTVVPAVVRRCRVGTACRGNCAPLVRKYTREYSRYGQHLARFFAITSGSPV